MDNQNWKVPEWAPEMLTQEQYDSQPPEVQSALRALLGTIEEANRLESEYLESGIRTPALDAFFGMAE